MAYVIFNTRTGGFYHPATRPGETITAPEHAWHWDDIGDAGGRMQVHQLAFRSRGFFASVDNS